MHILTTSKEYSSHETLLAKLPVGTTVVVRSGDDNGVHALGTALRRMLLTDSGFEVDIDFVEDARDWESKEAEEKYAAQQTRESVVRFFVKHDDDYGGEPQRHYHTMSNLEYDFLKHVRHDGSYLPVEDLEKEYNLFQICIRKDDSLEAVMAELKLVMEIQANQHPNINWHNFSIFEHTLSQHGSYHLVLKDGKWLIEVARYGRVEVAYSDDKLENCLQYIQKNLWYGDDEDDDDDEYDDYNEYDDD